MIVKDLIKILSGMPQDKRVYHLWDGEPRTEINVIYESKDGKIITSGYGEVCYSTRARPKRAPNEEQVKYWKTFEP